MKQTFGNNVNFVTAHATDYKFLARPIVPATLVTGLTRKAVHFSVSEADDIVERYISAEVQAPQTCWYI